jgi:hypothetical protein
MKKIYGIDQLVRLGAALDEGQSLPCILVAPELLNDAVSTDEIGIKEEEQQHREAIAFLPEPGNSSQGSRGIERSINISTGKAHYTSLRDGHIACGITRVSKREFETAKIHLDRASLGPIEISRFADGDLIRLFVHQTNSGPGVVIKVLTSHLLPDTAPPQVALNPFGHAGWQYLSSLFETAAFFWAITDGDKAFLLSSVQHFYPDLVARVHQRCLRLSNNLGQRCWAEALAEIQRQLWE